MQTNSVLNVSAAFLPNVPTPYKKEIACQFRQVEMTISLSWASILQTVAQSSGFIKGLCPASLCCLEVIDRNCLVRYSQVFFDINLSGYLSKNAAGFTTCSVIKNLERVTHLCFPVITFFEKFPAPYFCIQNKYKFSHEKNIKQILHYQCSCNPLHCDNDKLCWN